MTPNKRDGQFAARHLVDYPYYAFKFPILRNRVAHGKHIGGDTDEVADLLLLDLDHAASLLMSEHLPTNRHLSLIRDFKENPDSTNALCYLIYDAPTVPDFYKITVTNSEIKTAVDKEEFWNHIDRVLQSGSASIKSGIRRIVIDLKKKEIWGDKCVHVLSL